MFDALKNLWQSDGAERSPEELAHIAAVVGDPLNDTPRLAYAQWLRSNGAGEIAETIELDIRTGDMQPTDPEYLALCDRLDELQNAHGYQIYADLAKIGVLPEEEDEEGSLLYVDAWIDRGLVTNILLTDPTILPGRADEFFYAAPFVLSLEFWYDPIEMQALMQLPQMAQLHSLKFTLSELSTEDVRFLTESEHLTGLRQLELGGVEDPVAAARLLAKSILLGQLTHLAFDDVEIGEAGLRNLLSSGKLRQLKNLALGGARLGEQGLLPLLQCQDLSGLEELNLERNLDLGPAIGRLAVSSLKGLRRLSLASCYGGWEDGFRSFVEQLALPRLEALNLANNELGDAGARALAAAPWLARLKELNIAQCGVTVAGMQALAASRYLDQLTHLDCSENDLSEGGLAALVSARNLRLEGLTAIDCQLEAADVQALAKAPSCSSLLWLDLSGNDFDEDVVDALCNATFAGRLLSLSLSNITEEDEERLMAAFGEDVINVDQDDEVGDWEEDDWDDED
ncbi:hypothetical protein [Lignipirellula cremea]|uniref:Leucine Rich repeats (2 copies) n=1 Tax=Lignipirellula cremea TaxID=2528010 RepID=A0A518DM11_9BACT|nr:hypothetical protein [Lignipirellula cremea]QDU92878.1 Leucine Rich repeats (2 copies) [Lignipirellula cremea]